MHLFLEYLKQKIKVLRGFFPSKLPIGMEQFESFTRSIFDNYDFPDRPSYRNAVATMIMHLGPTTAYKSKWFFALSLKKSMANQVAYEAIQLLKQKEAEFIERSKPEAEALGTSLEPLAQ